MEGETQQHAANSEPRSKQYIKLFVVSSAFLVALVFGITIAHAFFEGILAESAQGGQTAALNSISASILLAPIIYIALDRGIDWLNTI